MMEKNHQHVNTIYIYAKIIRQEKKVNIETIKS